MCAEQFDKLKPSGSDDPSTIDDSLQTNWEAIDRLLKGYRRGAKVRYLTAATLTVEKGEIVCSNSGGSIRRFRSNTSAVTVSWSDIDTGSESNDTYYVWAIADTDIEGFTISISLSSSSPTGATYYALLGSFVNVSGDIDPAQINNIDINSSQWNRPEDKEREIGFRATLSAGRSIPDSTFTDVACDQEDYDYGDNYDTSNGKFTCDEPGRYLFCCASTGSVQVDGTYWSTHLYKNGSIVRTFGFGWVSTNSQGSVSGSAILKLDIGDYVEMYAYQNSGSSETIQSSSHQTYFEGIKIGR